MPTKAIVNCAVEQGFYTRLQERVLAACRQFGGDAELCFGGYPDGCPKHTEQNYAFKVWALDAAIAKGHKHLLWIDCRCRPVKSFQPIWDLVETEGYYVGQQGDSTLGEWCSDDALKIFGIDRGTARTIPLIRGGVFGFSLDFKASEAGIKIWLEYKRLCLAGAFNGAHKNTPGKGWGSWGGGKWTGHVSSDPTVGGHRHDESVLSFVLWNLGLKPSQDWTNIDVPEVSLIARNL